MFFFFFLSRLLSFLFVFFVGWWWNGWQFWVFQFNSLFTFEDWTTVWEWSSFVCFFREFAFWIGFWQWSTVFDLKIKEKKLKRKKEKEKHKNKFSRCHPPSLLFKKKKKLFRIIMDSLDWLTRTHTHFFSCCCLQM